ncbi:MAG TPA: ABC transporter permease [Candidatus Eisenbergiella intestinipullorum]|nr:ABC transporter permease [Candidatus Eisenbergiella intestinipullorum]
MPNIGIIKQSVQLSLENIKSNKMRTLLTTLGIIIGVTAVISLITIVNGAISTVMSEFSALGAGILTVSITGTPLKSGLTENDLESLEELDNVAGISPTISATGMAARNQNLLDAVSIQGKSEVYYEHNDLVTVGRPISRADVEDESYVCVIDQDIADNLFAGENPVGKTLTLNGMTYTVIGLEGENSDLMASMSGFGTSSDGTVTIPYTTARKVTGQKNISSLEIYIENTDYTEQLSDEVEGVLYQAFNQNEDSYFVFAMDSLLDTMNEMMSMLTYMLAGIASIALLVGGIGIMNMMLVSVSERKQEIGLRKAMGATPGRIQLQFLLESVVLSLIGGIIGVILGFLISAAAAALMDTDFVFSPSAVALGVGFSTAVGIIFGWAPARKASRLSPIDALRSE